MCGSIVQSAVPTIRFAIICTPLYPQLFHGFHLRIMIRRTDCYGCEREITGDRYMCVDPCLSYDQTGPNFCSACINLPSGTYPYHQPDHTLLKFSRFVQSRERLAFIGAAVPSLEQYHPTDCSVCHSTGKPLYWCCVICCGKACFPSLPAYST